MSHERHHNLCKHGLWTPREEIAFTAWPKIQSQSQVFRYGQSIFCLPHRPNFQISFDLCLHWVSVVRGLTDLTKSGGRGDSYGSGAVRCSAVCAPRKLTCTFPLINEESFSFGKNAPKLEGKFMYYYLQSI